MARSICKACLKLTGLFEAELLTELMLRFWKHPRAEDAAFRSSLLESAAEALRASIGGERLLESVSPKSLNLVAALWYSESVAVADEHELAASEREARRKWLDKVSRSLPSCFCDPEFLD